MSGGYDAADVAEMERTLERLESQRDLLSTQLVQLAQRLPVERARLFATQGVARRLRTVGRCVTNIFELFPPDRSDLLSMEECDDVAINLQAFAINVYALFDNVAWVCVLLSGAQIKPLDIGPFKALTKPSLPAPLALFLAEPRVQAWHKEYGKAYRDATAHRIPIYLPSRAYTEQEGARVVELEALLMDSVLQLGASGSPAESDERFRRHQALQAERDGLGSNSLLMALTLNGPDAEKPVFLHPQVLADYALVQELVGHLVTCVPQHFNL